MGKVNLPARKLTEIWLSANDSAAKPEDLARLDEAVIASPENRRHLIELTEQQAWLKWNGAAGCLTCGLPDEKALCAPIDGKPEATRSDYPLQRPIHTTKYRGLAETAAKVLGGFAIGACVAWLAAWGLAWRTAPARPSLATVPEGAQIRYVSSTQCLWDANSTGVPPVLGQRLRGGESLHLLEGIAELSVVSQSLEARLQLEGPVAVTISESGMASLRYGKMTLRIDGFAHETYPVETPFGRVFVEGGSEVGIASMGSTADVHAFQGAAEVESPWLVGQDQLQGSAEIHSGEALRIENVGSGTVEVIRTASDRDQFLPEVPMDSDLLLVGPTYIAEIRRGAPVAYWRFEQVEDGLVRNEMQDRYHGHLQRTVEWSGPRGNRAAQLGMSEDPGSIVVEDTWDEVLAGDFTIEAWIKPSHYQLGSVIGFVGEFDREIRKNKHGILLEVCGIPHSVRAKSIRFLHRSPPGHGPEGANCFTTTNYKPRRWQHVVAQREGHELRLFMNGELGQVVEDESATPAGLKLVIGQLYSEAVERFFTGQVDEVAIYDRALGPDEIRRHFELLRPAAQRTAARFRPEI